MFRGKNKVLHFLDKGATKYTRVWNNVIQYEKNKK